MVYYYMMKVNLKDYVHKKRVRECLSVSDPKKLALKLTTLIKSIFVDFLLTVSGIIINKTPPHYFFLIKLHSIILS